MPAVQKQGVADAHAAVLHDTHAGIWAMCSVADVLVCCLAVAASVPAGDVKPNNFVLRCE
jgi:hypothetical protein